MSRCPRYKTGTLVDSIKAGIRDKVDVSLYRVRHREGGRGSVIDEYELWVNDTLLAVLRDSIEYSLEEVPLEILFPISP